MKRLFYLILAVLFLVGAGLTWRHFAQPKAGALVAKGPGGPARPMPVKIAQVRSGPVVDSVSAVGTLLANESVMLRPVVVGRIFAIHFQ
ncbi:MAG: hypothetical protein ACK59Y_07915 [Betaproteobacteria bacterium]